MNNIDFRVKRRVQAKANWSDDWATVNYLEPIECSWMAAPQVSRATLLFRFGEILPEDGSAFVTRARTDIINKFVRIQTFYAEDVAEVEPTPAEEDWVTHWVGVVRDDASVVQSYDEEGHQEITAFGLESLLQTVFIETAHALTENAETIEINWLPSFNRNGKRTRTTEGNRSELPIDLGSSSSSAAPADVYVFGNMADLKTGNKWDVAQICDYLLHFHHPPQIPFDMWGQYEELALIKEVIDLKPGDAPVSVFDALNKLIDPKRGYCWHVDARNLSEEGEEGGGDGIVKIVVRTLPKTDITAFGETLHANDDQTNFVVPDVFPFSHICEAIRFRQTTVNQYDKVIVQSNPIRRMETFSYGEGLLREGAPDSLFTDYNDAEGATDPEVADAYRLQDRLEDVYRTLVIDPNWNRMISPLVGTGFEPHAAVPTVDDNGVVTYGETPGPFWPGQKVFTRDLLLEKGYDYTKEPPTPRDDGDGEIEFREMMVWVRCRQSGNPEGATGKWLWVDKMEGSAAAQAAAIGVYRSCSVRPLDRRMGFKLGIHPGHYYGLGVFPANGHTDTDPQFSYKDLVVTAAFTTDLRQRIVVEITSPMPETPRTLHYTVRGAEHWSVGPKTVIDIDGNGQPVTFHVDGTHTLRDGMFLLKSHAALLQAWYKEKRQAVRIVLRRIHQWTRPGQLFTSIEAAGFAPAEVNTVVTGVYTNFAAAQNAVTIETGYEDLDYVGMFSKGEGNGYRADGFGEPMGGGGNSDYPLSAIPLRLPQVLGGGSSAAGIWALVVSKTTIGDPSGEIRGKYICVEVEWRIDGTWQEKINGRRFVNCYEASTGSNANIQFTQTNIVQLWKVRTITESSSSESSASSGSLGGGEGESSGIPSSSFPSSSSGNIDRNIYQFDKALGGILRPAVV